MILVVTEEKRRSAAGARLLSESGASLGQTRYTTLLFIVLDVAGGIMLPLSLRGAYSAT